MTAVASAVFPEFCSAGLWPGVGSDVASALADAGIDQPSAVTEHALAALPGVTDKRARTLYSAWIGAQHAYDLAAILLPHGLPLAWTRRLLDRLGDGAAGLLSADPWQLLVLSDVSVPVADQFARAREPDVLPTDQRRRSALVVRALRVEARAGHTVAPISLISGELTRHGLRGPDEAVLAAQAAAAAGMAREVAEGAEGGRPWVSLTTLARAEESVAAHLARLEQSAQSLASAEALRTAGTAVQSRLDETQQAAVTAALNHGVSLLTGGPGTGKSRTIAALVQLCDQVGAEVALAAPTGRAAKRLAELLADASVSQDSDTPDAEAMTIHRLLGARLISDGEDGGTRSVFDRDADDPIEADMVVIDETSMLDAELAAALMNAIPSGAHLLFVGDPAQLPSIGPGRVLGDILAAGRYPVTELTTLYRQEAGGAIARLAAAVRDGELPPVDRQGSEVVVVPTADSAHATHRVVQLVTDSIPRVFGVQPDGIQVITPVHRGPAGTAALNEALKAKLNPGPHVGRKSVRGFDIGDRVVATANHFDADPNGYANGEIGTVIDADRRSLVVEFGSGPAEISGKALGDLLHGWAITVHRAQGSEWDAVVAVFPPEAGRMLSRPLVYTALTRGRMHLSVVHAAGRALSHAVRRIGARPRRTRLTALIAANDVIPDSSTG